MHGLTKIEEKEHFFNFNGPFLLHPTRIVVRVSRIGRSSPCLVLMLFTICKVCQVAGTLRIKVTSSSSIPLTQCHSSPKFSANLITPSSAPPLPSSSTMGPPISVLGIFPNPNFLTKFKLYFWAYLFFTLARDRVVDFNFKSWLLLVNYQMGWRDSTSCCFPQHCPTATPQSHWYHILRFHHVFLFFSILVTMLCICFCCLCLSRMLVKLCR